ncbi:MAG: T9SS type A sorting domain-containing protein [Taibaiella sp.]|nr:T9SS type A sorting domain-containing protein [Taibaiella sp.]
MRTMFLFLFLSPVLLHAQIITTVAGNGVQGFAGDGGPATAAQLDRPSALAFNKAGDMYIIDGNGTRVRRVSATGVITTVAGDGTLGYAGDGGPATAARVWPMSLATDTLGNLYIGERGRIRKIDATGIISTIAGDDTAGYNGDEIPATAARVTEVYLGFADEEGALWFCDNHRVRKIDNAGIIHTVAGTGANGSSGDGGPATAATMGGPRFLSRNSAGELFIPDINARRTRKINTADIIEAFAGYGAGGSTGGDGGPALSAAVANNTSVVCDDSGNVYLAMGSADVIRKVDAAGIISTVAGTIEGYSGDGGPASAARMDNVSHIAMYNGNLYLTDTYNNRIRRIGYNDPVSVSIREVGLSDVQIYPNPAAGAVNISAVVKVSSIAVYNVLGECIEIIPNIDDKHASIAIGDLLPGVYRIVVNGVGAGSFVKQ